VACVHTPLSPLVRAFESPSDLDTFMQRTKRLYADSRTAQSAAGSHLDRLNEDLQDVQKIMTKNMEDLLWRGDSLDRMWRVGPVLRRNVDHVFVAARRVAQVPSRCAQDQRRRDDPKIRSVRVARESLTYSVGALTILALFIVYIKFF